jgi:ABC-type antimicrobial peptide transport system permease subunit
VLGLLLTAAGLYGVMSFIVTRRTQEIGVRMALGASKRHTLALVLRRALALAGIGALIGVAGALALSRMLSSLLFGVSPRDPVTLGTVCAVAALASLLPALRATNIDPMEALRCE